MEKMGIKFSKRAMYGFACSIVVLLLTFEGAASVFSYGRKGTTFPIILFIMFVIAGFFFVLIQDWITIERKKIKAIYDNQDLIIEDAQATAIDEFGKVLLDKMELVNNAESIILEKKKQLDARAQKFLEFEKENVKLVETIENLELQIMNYKRLFELKSMNQNEESVCFDLGFLQQNRVVFVEKNTNDSAYNYYFYETKEGNVLIGEAIFIKRLYSSDSPNLGSIGEISTYICSDFKVKMLGTYELNSLPLHYKNAFILGSMKVESLNLLVNKLNIG